MHTRMSLSIKKRDGLGEVRCSIRALSPINAAEFVLIDPRTRQLLEPTSMLDGGEIKPFSEQMPNECSASIPLQ